METAGISLFPIPGSVSLPFTTVPLHIFEPRYRKMIQDSVALNRRVGVAHTIREVAPKKSSPDASIEEILNSNQESYEAHPIFSAGYVEIVETLPDGRMVVKITMDRRYEVLEELQQVPYKVVTCRVYEDEPEPDEFDTAEELRKQLDELLLSLPGEAGTVLKPVLVSPVWKMLSLYEYSFAVYSLILFEADTLQEVLEMKSASERIRFMIEALQD